jgi:uncharacterized protein YbjT (DUF2867 family)
MRDGIITVTGATGQQGGAVARALLKDGWRVRAFVRDASKPAAKALKQLGAEIALGDYENEKSIQHALNGAYGVYSVQTMFTPAGIAGEIRYGKALADAAKQAGVKHFVYGSVGAADQNTGIPHFESKAQVERHIALQGLPATILRPVFYFENFRTFFPPTLENGTYVLRLALHPGTRLGMGAVADIGAFAAIAFADPQHYVGRTIDVGGDEKTMPEVATLMAKQFRQPFRFEELPIESVRGFNADLAKMFEWFNQAGQRPDLAAARKHYPGLTDFATWLKTSGWDPTGKK